MSVGFANEGKVRSEALQQLRRTRDTRTDASRVWNLAGEVADKLDRGYRVDALQLITSEEGFSRDYLVALVSHTLLASGDEDGFAVFADALAHFAEVRGR